MQSAAPAPAASPGLSSLPDVVGRWEIGGDAQEAQAAGTQNWGFTDLGKDVLPDSLIVLPNFPFTGML